MVKDVEKEVDKRNKEFDDRRWRKDNVITCNLPEGESEQGLENKTEDETALRTIASDLDLDIDINTTFKLGKRGSSVRPMKAVLTNSKQRKDILKNANKISEKVQYETYKRVIITKDLTQIQRNERARKYEQMKKGAEIWTIQKEAGQQVSIHLHEKASNSSKFLDGLKEVKINLHLHMFRS